MFWMLELEMYEGEWWPRFVFTAPDEENANRRRLLWTRYQGFAEHDTRVREATSGEVLLCHDEYIDFLEEEDNE